MPMLQSLRVYMNSSKRAKYRARAKNNRAKIEGKTQGKGKGKTTNYYFPPGETISQRSFSFQGDPGNTDANTNSLLALQ